MAGLLLPPQFQFVDPNGVPYAGGTLATYIPNTLTGKLTYQNEAETILNSNPILLDDRGACTVFGNGDYRLILRDVNGVQVFDQLSSEPIDASAFGAVLPCLGLPSLQAFRDCSGVTAAIQQAVSAVSLITGPTGPTGPQGASVTGPTGPTGPAASGAQWSLAMPGWFLLGQLGNSPLVNWGFSSSDGTGHASVSFAKTYPNTCAGVTGTCVAPEGVWVNPTSITNGGFSAVTMSPYAPGSTFIGPIGFFWLSVGW